MKIKRNKYQHSTPILNISCSNSIKTPYKCLYSTFSDTITSHIHLVEYSNQTISYLTHNNQIDNPFPPTAIKFIPKSICYGDNFITSGEKLRLYNLTDTNNIFQLSTIDDSFNHYPSCGFDWCQVNCDLICCWYLNNTCTVWNIKSSEIVISFGNQTTKEINDMKYSPSSPDLYVISTNYGTLQLTDIRINMNSSEIFVQKGIPNTTIQPLTKITWNEKDSYKIATINEEGNDLYIIDIRQSHKPYKIISNTNSDDKEKITTIEWSKRKENEICIGKRNKIEIQNINTNEIVWEENDIEDEITDICLSKVKDDLLCCCIGNDIYYYFIDC